MTFNPGQQTLFQCSVSAKIAAGISGLARQAGMRRDAYATQLLVAAYSAKCGVADDAALSVAVHGVGTTPTAGSDEATAIALRARVSEIGVLRGKLAAAKEDARQASLRMDAANARAGKSEASVSDLRNAADADAATITRLRRELEAAKSLAEHFSGQCGLLITERDQHRLDAEQAKSAVTAILRMKS